MRNSGFESQMVTHYCRTLDLDEVVLWVVVGMENLVVVSFVAVNFVAANFVVANFVAEFAAAGRVVGKGFVEKVVATVVGMVVVKVVLPA